MQLGVVLSQFQLVRQGVPFLSRHIPVQDADDLHPNIFVSNMIFISYIVLSVLVGGNTEVEC